MIVVYGILILQRKKVSAKLDRLRDDITAGADDLLPIVLRRRLFIP